MRDLLGSSSSVFENGDLDPAFQTGDGSVQAPKGLNLSINRGEFVSFIGPSGFGTFQREIAVLDTHKSKKMLAKAQQYYNAFEKVATGLPRFTLTRGHVAIEDGVVKTQEGHGQFVARPPNGAVNRALSQWKDLTVPGPVVWSGIPAGGV